MEQRSFTDPLPSVYSDMFHKLDLCLINIPSTLTFIWTTDTQIIKRLFFSCKGVTAPFLCHLVSRDVVACRVVAAAGVTLCLRQQRQHQPPTM